MAEVKSTKAGEVGSVAFIAGGIGFRVETIATAHGIDLGAGVVSAIVSGVIVFVYKWIRNKLRHKPISKKTKPLDPMS